MTETQGDAAAGAVTEAPRRKRRVLRLHRHKKQYGGHSHTTEKNFIADFLFTLRDPGDPSSRVETFWCEVHLRHNLATRGAWKTLSQKDRFKALYCFAVEAIQKAGGRPIRQMSVSWVPGSPYAEGPHWDLSAVNLRRPQPVEIEGNGIVPVVFDQH